MTSPTDAALHARRAFIRRSGSLLVATVLLVSGACAGDGGSNPATAPTTSVAGNYNLRTIDGNAPPAEVYHGPWFDGVNKRFYNQMILVVKGGVINLDETDRWAMTFNVQVTLDDVTTQQTLAVQGTYTMDNGEIVMSTFDGSAAIAGTIRKGTIALTMDVGGNKREKAYSFTR